MEQIKLSPIESAAYWWVTTIRNKVKEIITNGASCKEEKRFAIQLYSFTEQDYRNLYLELIKLLEDKSKSYVPKYSDDVFSQDTEKNGHATINQAIQNVVCKKVPDIGLALNGIKDSVVYVTNSRASVWYKSCGEMPLSNNFEPSYILTGDEESLDFYNLLISVIAILHDIEPSFHSVAILRDTFCVEYHNNGSSEEVVTLKEKFDYWFNFASERGLIMGSSYKGTYFSSLEDIDLIGLDSYMKIAEYYANKVLEKAREGNGNISLKRANNVFEGD